MANVKNFGLIGLGSTVQYGKGGPTLTGSPVTSVLSADGTAAFRVPVGTTLERPAGAGGFIRANSDTSTLEFYNGTTWTTIATGGNTAAIQAEIDAIEASLGPAVAADGTFVPAAFTNSAAGAASFTAAINQVAVAAAGKDTLEEIEPVVAIGNIIYADTAATWAQALPGATSGVQPYSSALGAIAANVTPGILVQTAAGEYASRTLVAPAEGITITSPDGVAGNPTFALAGDLAGVEGLTTFGYAVRTADDTWTTREITGAAGRILVTEGTGVASNTDIDLALLADGATGTFLKFTRDAYGRVSGTTAVVAGDITGLVDTAYVSVAGDTMTGNLVMSPGTVVTLPDVPAAPTDAVNKAYVDSLINGLTWKQPVVAASTPADGNIVISAPPATLDGVTLVAGDRILLKNQTTNNENLIYIFTSTTVPLDIAPDSSTPEELLNATVFVSGGTVNADSGWTQTGILGGNTVEWVQFSGSSTYVAGTGLSLSGNTFNVGAGAGITVGADDVSVKLFSPTAGAIILTEDGTTRSTLPIASLSLLLPAAGGLTQDGTGLYIAADGITNDKLLNDFITFGSDAGTENVILGGTLTLNGTSGQGISTASTAGVITITAANASASQKGVASFTTGEFVVTAGNVALGAIPPTSLPGGGSFTVVGDDGAPGSTIALNTTLSILGDTVITTESVDGTVTLTLGTVPVGSGGTGLTAINEFQVLFGGAGNTIVQDSALAFNGTTNTLTLGTATLEASNVGGHLNINTTLPDSDIRLTPGATGSVVVGPAGAGIIQSDTAAPLTVIGSSSLTLQSGTGSTTVSAFTGLTLSGAGVTVTSSTGDVDFNLTGAGAVLHVTAPLAATYQASVTDPNDIPNKAYVDAAIAAGGGATASGAVKAIKAVIDLSVTDPQPIGTIPANATILSVKVNVTEASTAGTLVVAGAAGPYITALENDLQAIGLYLAETAIAEAAGGPVTATVTGGVTGSAGVYVEYQNAEVAPV